MTPKSRFSLLPLALLLPRLASAAESAVLTSDGRILQDTSTPTSVPVVTSSPTAELTSLPTVTSSPTAEQIPGAPTLGPWQGCVNPNDPTAQLVRGKQTVVCLHVGPGGDWNRRDENDKGIDYMRYTFTPLADDYSVYRLPNSFNNLVVQERAEYLLPNITVFSASGTGLSFLRHYYEKNVNETSKGKIFPHLTAIIDVKNGVVTGLTWDDACVFCKSSLCIENTYNFNGEDAIRKDGSGADTRGCYLTYEQCQEIHAGDGTGECDLTLFVVWTGSDVNGNVMSSSNSRFSAFEPRQIQDKWTGVITDSIESVGDSINDAKDTVTGTVDGAVGGVGDAISGLNPLGGDDEEEEGEAGAN